jgi:ubiquinone/menaquinone biosynthesis C-methylase UbiE
VNDEEAVSICAGVAEKYRKVAVSPEGLFRYPTGEAVLDLGCGAGFDSFVAAQLVGPTGRVAGVDLSPEMIAVAEADLRQTEFSRVQFRVGTDARLVGTGEYRTSGHTQATFYTARKPTQGSA